MYEFTEDCMIHIEQIDNEHRKLFQMLNEAFTMLDTYLAYKDENIIDLTKPLPWFRKRKMFLPLP